MSVTPRARKITLLFVAPLLLVGLASVVVDGWIIGRLLAAGEIERILTVTDGDLVVQGRRIQAAPAGLWNFYAARSFQPVWFDARRPRPEVRTLSEAVVFSLQEGLNPDDYLRISRETQELLDDTAPDSPDVPLEVLAGLDVALTDTFVALARDLSYGRVNPEQSCSRECFAARDALLLAGLRKALDEHRLAELLQSYIPRDISYARLKDVRAACRNIAAAGGWPEIPPGAALYEGMGNDRVAALRERLRLSGDLAGETPDTDSYDVEVADAVRRFQKRRGVEANGAVDDKTLLLLNEPVEDDIRRIELNLERWRWLPRELGERHILVNVPAFHLAMVEKGETVLDMKTIVGRPPWYTPSFSGRISYLEVNPVWRVPPNIINAELVSIFKRDPGYITRNNMKLYGRQGSAYGEIPPGQVDWKHVKPNAFPYLVVQEAGPQNPLGKVKFMFPNQNYIYLHDTPTKRLFSREQRMFSHGCIRVENAIGLAERLLQEDRGWLKNRFAAEVRKGKTSQIVLRKPVDVHVVYFTAWVDEAGLLHTRPDVYGYDEALDTALRKRNELIAGISFD